MGASDTQFENKTNGRAWLLFTGPSSIRWQCLFLSRFFNRNTMRACRAIGGAALNLIAQKPRGAWHFVASSLASPLNETIVEH